MENNTQARKWALVINNPLEAGLDHAAIREILRRFAPSYFCMADEVATTGTYHTHIFLLAPSPIRFSTIKNRFPTAHIEKAYGSVMANRAYILKEGHWADTDKAETSVSGTFEEWGDLPAEKEEEAPEMFKLIQDLRAGKSVMEIIEDNPKLAFRIREIETLRQAILEEKYSAENRVLEVTYLYGASGTGKHGAFSRSMTGKAFAVSPTTAAGTASDLTPIIVRMCWCWRNFIRKSPSAPCSIIWTSIR